MKNHQGTIDFETTSGKGTTFIVRLPATEHGDDRVDDRQAA